MTRKREVIEESAKAPAYLVTFGALVTLLMLFFVMLLSLASTQDEGLFGQGRESFLQSIRGLGLGRLYRKKDRPDFGNVKIKYFISTPDKLFEGRSIHAKKEQICQIFEKISQSMKAMPSQIVAKKTNFSVTDIRFLPGDATLNEPAKKFLAQFCLDLRQNPESRAGRLYVLGLACDEPTEKQQWILSARRAQVVADFLRDILHNAPSSQTQYGAFGASSEWAVYSWGAGPGGDWVGSNSPVSRQSQILITVLREND